MSEKKFDVEESNHVEEIRYVYTEIDKTAATLRRLRFRLEELVHTHAQQSNRVAEMASYARQLIEEVRR